MGNIRGTDPLTLTVFQMDKDHVTVLSDADKLINPPLSGELRSHVLLTLTTVTNKYLTQTTYRGTSVRNRIHAPFRNHHHAQ